MGDAIRPPATRGGVTFEVERLERDGDQLVVCGHWSGLRGVRFVRPTLVHGERHVLATLEHKPWAPRDDREWIAAFPWKGRTPDATELELAVAPSISVGLGPPGGEPAPARAPAPEPAREPALALVPEMAPEPEPQVAEPVAPENGDRGAPANVRMRMRLLEHELDETRCERDELARARSAAERELEEARRERDELSQARIAAERERDLAQAQRDEAVQDREAAIRTRTRMELAQAQALEAQAVVQAELDRAHAERDEAHSQRDEVLLAYRALQRHMRSERAGLDRIERGDDAAAADPEEPLGVRTIPAARTIMAELQRPAPSSKFVVSKFDVWVVRVLGSVAAGCFILLLLAIIRVFI